MIRGSIWLWAAMAGAMAGAAKAQPGEDGLELAIGAGAVRQPEYPGADDMETRVIPFAVLRYERRGLSVEVTGPGIAADLIPDDRFVAGPVVRYRRGRDDVSDPLVGRLPELDDAVEGGLRVAYRAPLGESGRVTLAAEYLTDLTDAHEGQTGRVELALDRSLAPNLSGGLRAGVTYGDGRFMRSYFGVDAAGAAASLPAYRPDAGLQGADVGASLQWRVGGRWSVIGAVTYERLLSEAADSPIVRLRGDRDQLTTLVGLVWAF